MILAARQRYEGQPEGLLRRSVFLLLAMVACVACVGALAWWDGARESAEALDDFGMSQATLATSLVTGLAQRFEHSPLAKPSEVLQPFARFERPSESLLLFVLPGSTDLVTLDGRHVSSQPLQRALASGASTVRLSRPEALELGLPQRTAVAGLAHIDAGAAGRLSVVVVATALRERDRERRAAMRLTLSVLLAALVVGVFGGLALREQRRELLLARTLEMNEAARVEDARLQRLNRAATMLTMASGVAHEIATPLGVIVGRAEQLLMRLSGDERAQRALQTIVDQAASIDAVVRGFLDLARGGAPALQSVAPAAVAAAAVRLVEHRFAQAQVTLTSQVAEGLPQLRCEPRLLEHAITNLLLNACDACAPGGHVELTAEAREGSLRFTVLDNGAGITVEDAARAAQPFFTTKPHGTGLGLAIASEIAKTHRGTLHIEPSLPTGTRACVQIPLSPGGADA
jgi:signal transduction histidine kinase